MSRSVGEFFLVLRVSVFCNLNRFKHQVWDRVVPVRTLLLILTQFVFCWVPLHFSFLIHLHQSSPILLFFSARLRRTKNTPYSPKSRRTVHSDTVTIRAALHCLSRYLSIFSSQPFGWGYVPAQWNRIWDCCTARYTNQAESSRNRTSVAVREFSAKANRRVYCADWNSSSENFCERTRESS